MSSIASLRRKDNMWIYKNPQGLQVLNDELNERRKKRSARTTRFISTPPLSPTKSTKQHMIPIAKISQNIRPPSPPQQQQQQRPKLVKTKEYQQNPNLTEEIHLREKKITTVLLPVEKESVALKKKNSVLTEKTNLPEKKSLSETMSLPIVPKRKGLPEKKTLPGKIDLSQWKPKSMDEKNKNKLSVITSTTHVTQPSLVVVQESHSSNNNNSLSPLVINQPDSSLHNPTNHKHVSPQYIISPVASPTSPVASPPAMSSPIKRVKSPPAAAENQFLIEAKQKLFSKQQSSIRKNLPSTPTAAKKSGMVSSFISAFETPTPGRTTQDKVLMAPTSFTPPSSISTPLLSPPVTTASSETTVTPISSCSTPVTMKDSYFSEVIDRRFSPTPTETEDEPILVYLPQLSPDMSFCTNALDIPSDDDITFQKRPCIKKQVSFSEQLSTVINDLVEEPDEEEDEEEEAATSPISSFVRTLSNELSNHSAALPKANSNREKFIPVLVKNEKKKEGVVVPQKLSNKLLDIFQKKPIATTTAAPAAPAATTFATSIATPVDQPARKELVHLTKSRPRKPASLKKPTNLAYPAAIAQPDWRTRVITTKKSPVFI